MLNQRLLVVKSEVTSVKDELEGDLKTDLTQMRMLRLIRFTATVTQIMIRRGLLF